MTPDELSALTGFLTSGLLVGLIGRWFDLVTSHIGGR